MEVALDQAARRDELERRRALRRMKVRATGLLVLAAAVYVAARLLADGRGWAGYVQAMTEAAMVGGLADWFAVTALFRHPLGIPIPHTAIVVERKDQFVATLGAFIEESFLTPEVIVERVRAAAVVPRLASWLVVPANVVHWRPARPPGRWWPPSTSRPTRTSTRPSRRSCWSGSRRCPWPRPWAAAWFATANGRHDQVLDAALVGLDRYLAEHGDELRDRLGTESPWWLPGAVEDRIFERLIDGARTALRVRSATPRSPRAAGNIWRSAWRLSRSGCRPIRRSSPAARS